MTLFQIPALYECNVNLSHLVSLKKALKKYCILMLFLINNYFIPLLHYRRISCIVSVMTVMQTIRSHFQQNQMYLLGTHSASVNPD